MGATLAYGRVSTNEQSTEAQRFTIAERYSIEADHWFEDQAVSGSVKALKRRASPACSNSPGGAMP